MVKYKVSFEITDGAADFLSSDKEKWIETQKQLIKSSIYELELEYQGMDLNKVTDFKIEEVEEND